MSQSSKLSSLANRVKNSLPSKQTAILRLKDGGIIVGFLASAYFFVPPLWDAISVSPQQRVRPLEQRITDLDKQIKSSPKPSTTDLKEIATLEKGRIDTEHAIRTSIVQATVGFLGIAAVLIAWKQWKAAQEKQVAERFSKAVEQLGSKNIHARLGGIYALEQIAKDAEEKYYWQVMETLTSYVRIKSPYPPNLSEQPNIASETPLNIDIQAVMTVIARRKHQYGQPLEPNCLNLRSVDLHQLELPPNAKLQGADFRNANLQAAQLEKANLEDANLQFVNFQKAQLSGANLQKTELFQTNFQSAILQKIDLQESKCLLANFQEAFLKGANFKKAVLVQAVLCRAVLESAMLREAKLMGANLQQADLTGANLQKAILGRMDLLIHF